MIRVENGSFSIEDVGSRNGTYVNRQKIEAPVRLGHNDMIQFGDAVAKFDCPEAAPAPAPAPAAAAPAPAPAAPAPAPAAPAPAPAAPPPAPAGGFDPGGGTMAATIVGEVDIEDDYGAGCESGEDETA